MAYATRNLSVLAYANGFTMWHYASPDPAREVAGFGYFDPGADLLRPGDVLFVGATDATAVYAVASCDGDRVRLAPLSFARHDGPPGPANDLRALTHEAA